MKNYTFLLIITLVLIPMIGNARKYPILTSYNLIYSTGTFDEKNALIFSVPMPIKETYNLLMESLTRLNYYILIEEKHIHIEANSMTKINVIRSDLRNAFGVKHVTDYFNVWLNVLSNQETRICI